MDEVKVKTDHVLDCKARGSSETETVRSHVRYAICSAGRKTKSGTERSVRPRRGESRERMNNQVLYLINVKI